MYIMYLLAQCKRDSSPGRAPESDSRPRTWNHLTRHCSPTDENLASRQEKLLAVVSCLGHARQAIAMPDICDFWCAQLRAQILPNAPNTVFGAHIWERKIWSSGVSLKRSCKMQFRRIDLVSMRPPSQELWPNLIFGRFPHSNYNLKLKSAGRFLFYMVYKFETFCGTI